MGGGGGVYNKRKAKGVWTAEETLLHINVLEIKAILFGRKTFFNGVWNSNFLIYSDNTTAVITVNKMGTSRSRERNAGVHETWH